MRIEPSPSPLVPPEFGSPSPSADATAGTTFASLLADDTAGEPAKRALTFVELGMFGAYAGVSPAPLAVGIEEKAQETEPPRDLPPVPGVEAGSVPDRSPAAADAKIDQPAQLCSAYAVAEASAATRYSTASPRSGGFTEPAAVVDEAAPVAVSLSRTASAPGAAPAEVRPRTVMQPSFKDVGLGAAPEKGRVPKQTTGRAPLAAVLIDEGGTAKLAVAAAALAPGGAARLRAVAARLLAEHGIELGEMWINGGSEPASAAQGEGHGSRTR